jgi:integrase
MTLNDAEPGLNLRITAQGTAAWTWLGHDSVGRVRRFGLGRYPHVQLAEARRRARRMADEVRRGADPVAEARARRAGHQKAKGHTLAALLALYGQQKGKVIKSWASQMEPQIKRVFRAHLDAPLADLTIGTLQMTVDGYPSPKSAGLGVTCLLTVLRWASASGRGYVDRSLLELQAIAKKPERDRVISRDELTRILPVMRTSDSPYASALRLILLTAARRGEVEAARWQDVNFAEGTWTIPDPKNKQEHIVPLCRQAIDLLQARQPERWNRDPAEHVFTINGGRPIGNGWEKATKQIQAASETSGWQRHDLRRTAATMMGNLGVMPDVIEAALNHVTIRSKIASIYNKSRYRPEVADALQRLGDALDGIEQGAATVIALRPAKIHDHS